MRPARSVAVSETESMMWRCSSYRGAIFFSKIFPGGGQVAALDGRDHLGVAGLEEGGGGSVRLVGQQIFQVAGFQLLLPVLAARFIVLAQQTSALDQCVALGGVFLGDRLIRDQVRFDDVKGRGKNVGDDILHRRDLVVGGSPDARRPERVLCDGAVAAEARDEGRDENDEFASEGQVSHRGLMGVVSFSGHPSAFGPPP